MLRFLSALILSLTIVLSSNATAGPLKWALRSGAVVCTKSTAYSGFVARGAVASAAWDKVDAWMKQNGDDVKEPLSPMFGHNSGHMPEDPDDPFGENKKDEKPIIGKKLDYIF